MPTKLYDLDTKRRDAILNAALKEFAQKGFDKTSTNIIAKEAGISKPLLFHYIGSKQELFQFVIEYFSNLLNTKYFQLLNCKETDALLKLHQSYTLQIALLKEYPWIFEFAKLDATSEKPYHETDCYSSLFQSIDEDKFKPGLDVEKCKEIIFWSCTGYANQMLEEIRNTEYSNLNYEAIEKALENFFAGLREIFYKPGS